MIELDDLSFAYGYRRALRDVGLRVGQGELLALFGPNGAGKTTLLRVVIGLFSPTRGQVRVAGHHPRVDRQEVRRRAGMLAHASYLYGELTVEENLLLHARLHTLSNPRGRVETILEEFGLADRSRTRTVALSRGLKKRLALARTVIHDPAILLLDEPYEGLDSESVRFLNRWLGRFRAEGGAGILATHDHGSALAICDRIAVLVGGELVHHGPLPDASQRFDTFYASLTGVLA